MLAWSASSGAPLPESDESGDAVDPATKAAIRLRDDPLRKAQAQIRAADMGGTALPADAVLINARQTEAKAKTKSPGKQGGH